MNRQFLIALSFARASISSSIACDEQSVLFLSDVKVDGTIARPSNDRPRRHRVRRRAPPLVPWQCLLTRPRHLAAISAAIVTVIRLLLTLLVPSSAPPGCHHLASGISPYCLAQSARAPPPSHAPRRTLARRPRWPSRPSLTLERDGEVGAPSWKILDLVHRGERP